MYKIEKRFKVPIGHSLYNHNGLCNGVHGHNLLILLGIKRQKLNDDDMVMDFSKISTIMKNKILDDFDHAMLLNENDEDTLHAFKMMKGVNNTKIITFPFDPTAERLSEYIYTTMKKLFEEFHPDIEMDYVTIYENENSKATYEE